MPGVRIGIQTRSLRQPLKQALRTAARLGADGVEIDARAELRPGELSGTGLREFHKLLDDLHLRVSAIAFPTRRGYDVSDDLERRVQATQAAMRFARELRADVVINRVGQVPAEARDSRFTRLVEALTALGTYGERVGARFAAQTGGDRPQDLARLIDALPEDTVGVDLHPTGLILGGQSPRDAVEVLGPHVLHVHACDAVRDAGRSLEVELGRGSADLPELLGRLTEFDYRGWITIERRESANPIAEIENAVAYLRAL
ncbi:MAG: sugar phosphate isomerase/epimerase [Planctomycetes bacterium]|nr:sugar phosphate isomerase/epimerase [Planctomycetota bacterium]